MKSFSLRFANSLITIVLVAIGLAVLHWFSCLGLDAAAAGGLAGALFGAAALFVGAEISKYDRQLAKPREQGIRHLPEEILDGIVLGHVLVPRVKSQHLLKVH